MWRTAEGGESGRGEKCSLKEWSLFLQVVYLFVQAAIDVLFKVVWVTAACRPGFHDLANATITLLTLQLKKVEFD